MSQGFLPYSRQTIDEDDIAAVAAALSADMLTTGPRVEEFEQAFAHATGAANAVACNSGTAALHLAALALDLAEGQTAVVPAMTFLATANVVRMTGAEVVLADVDPDTGLLTPATFEAAVARGAAAGRKVRAAFPVHLNGQVCDMAGLAAAAARHGIALVEDACHVLGLDGIGATAHSAAACFSTHPVKAIATGEGGVVTTRDADAAERMRRLRSHGMVREPGQFTNRELGLEDGAANPWYYEMSEIGWNYRMPDILCALGIAQLKKLDRFHARRRAIAARYERLLAPLAPAIRPVSRAASTHGWHLYVIHADFRTLGTTRARLMKALRAEGIGTQVHYIPLHWQPYYRRRYGAISLPGAEAYYQRCLSIPMFPAMSDADVERVAAVLAQIAQGVAA
ncbi:MAG: UDP-4-amino-4,6-dideoxy-N-acetyl-beta-L-altrosamine transaminase [Xanthobacteraceae bacterium]